MANKLDNLRKGGITSEQAPILGSKGGKASVEAKRRKKTMAQYLQLWANSEVADKDKKILQASGFGDEELTKRVLLVHSLLKKAQSGDLKAMQMIMELLDESNKKELEIKKLKEEIKLLKLEQAKMKMITGEDRQIEDLTPLVTLLGLDEYVDEDKDD